MINPGGDALNPLISPYTAYDVLGTWDNGGLGQVGINQISGSTQFDALNGFQTTFKVGQQAIPLLYSQTSANTFDKYNTYCLGTQHKFQMLLHRLLSMICHLKVQVKLQLTKMV